MQLTCINMLKCYIQKGKFQHIQLTKLTQSCFHMYIYVVLNKSRLINFKPSYSVFYLVKVDCLFLTLMEIKCVIKDNYCNFIGIYSILKMQRACFCHRIDSVGDLKLLNHDTLIHRFIPCSVVKKQVRYRLTEGLLVQKYVQTCLIIM